MIISEARANIVRSARSEPLGALVPGSRINADRVEPVLFPEVAVTTTGNVSVPRAASFKSPRAAPRESRLFDPFRTMCTQCRRDAHHGRVGGFPVKPTHAHTHSHTRVHPSSRPPARRVTILFRVMNAFLGKRDPFADHKYRISN
jgi:hypothetical protein